jgi:hypothetical protein
MVIEILQRPEASKRVTEKRFGSEFSAELMRTLAAWKGTEPNQAYQKLVAWNVDFFFKHGAMQERFIATIIGLAGPGAEKVRADITLTIVEVAQQEGRSSGAMLTAAKYLSQLTGGDVGARMVMLLERMLASGRRVQQLMAHILKWDIYGQRRIGELLAMISYQIAKESVGSAGATRESDQEKLKARSSLLGRVVAHVEMAVDDWASIRAKGRKEASAAHGATILNFALEMVLFLLPGAASKVVDSSVKSIKSGITQLQAYESGRERPRGDPREERKKWMIEAAHLPFLQMVQQAVNEGLLDESTAGILVERFRNNVATGRDTAYSSRS